MAVSARRRASSPGSASFIPRTRWTSSVSILVLSPGWTRQSDCDGLELDRGQRARSVERAGRSWRDSTTPARRSFGQAGTRLARRCWLFRLQCRCRAATARSVTHSWFTRTNKEALDELPAGNWGASAGLHPTLTSRYRRAAVSAARHEGGDLFLPVRLLGWLNA